MINESRSLLYKNSKKLTAWYFKIEDPTFIENEKGFYAKMIYIQNNQRKAGILYNEKILMNNWYDVGKPVFNPQAKEIAFKVNDNPDAGIRPKNNYIALNGMKATDGHDWIKDEITFAPVGRDVVYAAEDNEKWAIYIGNKKITSNYDNITAPVFRPISKSLVYGAKSNNLWHIYENDTIISPAFEEVSIPVFCANGKNVAYKIKKGDQLWMR